MNTTEMTSKRSSQAGYTITELMIVIALVALLSSFAIPAFNGYIDDAKVSSAVGDMGRIVLEIEKYRTNNNDQLPPTLGDLNLDSIKDPWDKNYKYVPVTDPGDLSAMRQKPGVGTLNRDYDLLSRGPDGMSARNITKSKALDDIIRANNGAYMGLAEDY